MAEKKSSLLNQLISTTMSSNEHQYKNVSEAFAILRAKLNAKEKELLELQRAEPSLLVPDVVQIDLVIDAISSLHLSTSDGSFLFASNSKSLSNDVPDNQSSTSFQSTGVDLIKTLPSNVWLSERKHVKEEEKTPYRLPMVSHLFSLPLNNFVASSSSSNVPKTSSIESVEKKDEPPNRLPFVSQIFAMPLDAFKSSSKNATPNETTKPVTEKKETINESKTIVPPTHQSPKSILDGDSVYSKDFWLRRSKASNNETTTKEDPVDPFDFDQYIEQTSEKMRRLHLEYLSAIEQLKNPSSTDSTSAIKSIYPQVFDRIQPNLPTKNKTSLQSSTK